MRNYVHYFFKLKFYLGLWDATRVFWSKIVLKSSIKVKFINYNFFIRHSDFADNQVFNEVILKRSYTGLLPKKDEVKRILDLGANIGLSSISFLSEYPNAELIAIEPEDENFSILSENLGPYNDNFKRAKLLKVAVWSHDEELYLIDSGTGTHGYRTIENQNEGKVLKKIKGVSIRTLLKINGWDRDILDIVKIDIEGGEKNIFESDIEWVQKVKCLIIETHDRFLPECSKTVFKALENYNYRLEVKGSNLVFYFI